MTINKDFKVKNGIVAAQAITSTGANVVNQANAVKLSQEAANYSALASYGASTGVQGTFGIVVKSSDGSLQTNSAVFNSSGTAINGQLTVTGAANGSSPVTTFTGNTGIRVFGQNPTMYIEGDTNSYYPGFGIKGIASTVHLGTYAGGQISSSSTSLSIGVNALGPDTSTVIGKFSTTGLAVTGAISANTGTFVGALSSIGPTLMKATGALTATNAYVSFQDSGAVERGWVGFGTADGRVTLANTLGSINIISAGVPATFSVAGLTLTGALSATGSAVFGHGISSSPTAATTLLLADANTGLDQGRVIVNHSGANYVAYGTSGDGSHWLGITDSAGGTTTRQLIISPSGVITDGASNELGFKNIPPIANTWVRGKCNVVTASTSVNVSAAGDTYSLYNNNTVAVVLTQTSGLTMYLGGTNTTGNRSILPHGFATIWYMDAATAVINGNVT